MAPISSLGPSQAFRPYPRRVLQTSTWRRTELRFHRTSMAVQASRHSAPFFSSNGGAFSVDLPISAPEPSTLHSSLRWVGWIADFRVISKAQGHLCGLISASVLLSTPFKKSPVRFMAELFFCARTLPRKTASHRRRPCSIFLLRRFHRRIMSANRRHS
jgi:hypothetical protein